MADKIILKRSSILGKRPTNKNIQAGELALNTNSEDPGAFFQVSDGNVVKVGPVSVSPLPPVKSPERGESWFDTERGTLNIGHQEDFKKVWKTVASPYLGGSEIAVFVAPEFEASTDSLLNDGQALPYQSLNRALLEVTKLKIKSYLSNGKVSEDQERYVIYLAPSLISFYNDRGVTAENLSLSPSFNETSTGNLLINDLTQFNSPYGGLIIPGGVSIRGLDDKKCEAKPSYVPRYKHPGIPEGEAGVDDPISCILRVSGNTSCSSFSVSDRVEFLQISKIDEYNTNAIFFSRKPHGLSKNSLIKISFSRDLDQGESSFKEGFYYVNPVDSFSFLLSERELGSTGPLLSPYIPFAAVPSVLKGQVVKIFCSVEPRSAHRLRVFSYSTAEELADYYAKVQKAFPLYFGGFVTDGIEIVNDSDYLIVAPSDSNYIENFSPSYTKNSSYFIDEVRLRSNYGMCYGDFDGNTSQGLRSSSIKESYIISVQNDPAAYEIYTTVTDPNTGLSEQGWWPLIQATYFSLPSDKRPELIVDTPKAEQLKLLIQTPIDKIRYHYQNLTDSQGKSYGIVNTDKDFRHFGIRSVNGGHVQGSNIFALGTAIGFWALNGGYISVSNSNSSFGSVAIKSEGFRGIGTIGGAFPHSKGFLFKGIQTPLALNRKQAEDNSNKNIYSLGSRIINVRYSPDEPGVQLLDLNGDFRACFILPFSLKPGSALWVSSSDCTYRGFFATDGGPTVIENPGPCSTVTLRIRASDSTIPSDPVLIDSLDIPYIRRFRDPREEADRSYSIVIENTSSQALAPSVGSILRLDQTSQGIETSHLRPNVQLDPGGSGGWGRVFTVSNVYTATRGHSPNFNYVVGDGTQDSRYLVNICVSDYSRPWQQSQNNSQGEYVTYQNKNWYAAENNTWDSVYYGNITPSFGPLKLAPTEACSPFVSSNTLERQELIDQSYQGVYAFDTKTLGEGAEEYKKMTYFRGSTIPYTEFSAQNPLDDDDGTNSLGLILKRRASGKTTTLISSINPSATIQEEVMPSENSRYRPEVVRFSVLSSIDIPNPRQTVSILKLTQTSPVAGVQKEEYLRVIGLNGNTVEAIRLNRRNSFYPDPVNKGGSLPIEWPALSIAQVCNSDTTPETSVYDPSWSNTKKAVYRFLEVMGYSSNALLNCPKPIKPYYWGDRFISFQSLPAGPDLQGYALATAEWTLEFNQPSTVLATAHNWSYCGFPILNRELTQQETNELPRKLGYDFLSTALWGGRLTVTGVNSKGESISFGPQTEAVTAQYYSFSGLANSAANQQIYEEQPYVEFPAQVIVYSVDDISSQFDNSKVMFELKKGGIPIPVSQLDAHSMFVQVGGVVQKPEEDYKLINNTIMFSTAPRSKAFCDIRIVTSEDNGKTLVSAPLGIQEEIDGLTSTFTLVSTTDISTLDINQENTFVFIGGVQQIPGNGGSYVLSRLSTSTLSITFTEPLPEGVNVNIRAICSGSFWESQGKSPVAVYALDSISEEFNPLTLQKDFLLTYKGQPVNPSAVNTFNTMVSVGGVLQLPGDSYVIENGVIKFTDPPTPGSTSDIRVITNAEFLPCVNSQGFSEGFISWGASVVLNLINEVAALKGK